MKQVTTTKTQKIYSTSSQMQLALYQPVGTSGKDNVYIYQTKPRQKKPQHTQANEFTTNRLVWTDSDQATLTVKETRWRFKNDFYKVLFAGSKMDGNLVSRTNTFRYPKTFVKISVKQATGTEIPRSSGSVKNTSGRLRYSQNSGSQAAKS